MGFEWTQLSLDGGIFLNEARILLTQVMDHRLKSHEFVTCMTFPFLGFYHGPIILVTVATKSGQGRLDLFFQPGSRRRRRGRTMRGMTAVVGGSSSSSGAGSTTIVLVAIHGGS